MEKALKKYYRKYKQDIAPTALFLAGILLLTQIILPQFGEISGVQSEVSTQQETNENLRESDSVLSSISNSQLENDYELVMDVLPANKSVGSIFEALNTAAGVSSVAIGSLNVQVGTVYDQGESVVEQSSVEGVPYLNMIVRAEGNSTTDMINFANTLHEAAPVVEVNSIATSDTNASYDVNFYYKPINENSFEAQTTLTPLTPQQQDLLSSLETWVR